MGWGRGRTDPPTAASPIAICNDRYTSIRDIQSVATNVRYGEGFRTPALCRTVVGVLGPAFESLPRRKPRVGRDAVWSGAAYGDFRIGTARVCRGLVARKSWRRDRRRQACLVASMRGPGAGAAVGGGLATS